ncbi:MAG TPA: AP endonuclease, partial [Clostridium sp.]|nr:AP endonuclease [Clostridium sp.]
CLKAFEALITGINEKNKEIELIANKYSSNRIQRRSKK